MKLAVWRWLEARFRRRYRKVGALRELESGAVIVEGRVHGSESLRDPVTGEAAVVIFYRALPPSTVVGLDGASTPGSRGFQLTARQAVDFVLDDGTAQVRVHVDPGEDIGSMHARLVARYGVGLRTERELVRAGERIRVVGRAHVGWSSASPHRRDPELAVLDAEELWAVGAY